MADKMASNGAPSGGDQPPNTSRGEASSTSQSGGISSTAQRFLIGAAISCIFAACAYMLYTQNKERTLLQKQI